MSQNMIFRIGYLLFIRRSTAHATNTNCYCFIQKKTIKWREWKFSFFCFNFTRARRHWEWCSFVRRCDIHYNKLCVLLCLRFLYLYFNYSENVKCLQITSKLTPTHSIISFLPFTRTIDLIIFFFTLTSVARFWEHRLYIVFTATRYLIEVSERNWCLLLNWLFFSHLFPPSIFYFSFSNVEMASFFTHRINNIEINNEIQLIFIHLFKHINPSKNQLKFQNISIFLS